MAWQRAQRLPACLGLVVLTWAWLILCTEACNFTFFPEQVNSQIGPRQMLSVNYGHSKDQLITDPVNERKSYEFSLTSRLVKPINPRLCRWLVSRNDRTDAYFPDNSVERFPLTPEHGLPKVRCMINPNTPGLPVTQFPMFTRNGALLPFRNAAIKKLPLCGDMFYFRAGTLLHFNGVVEAGTIKILECQAGTEQDSQDWVMHALFTVDCSGEIPSPTYITPEQKLRELTTHEDQQGVA